MKSTFINSILRLSRPQKRTISVITDFLLLSLAVWAAFALRFENLRSTLPYEPVTP